MAAYQPTGGLRHRGAFFARRSYRGVFENLKSKTFLLLGKWGEAIDAAEKGVDANARVAWNHLAVARAFLEAQKHSEMAEACERGLQEADFRLRPFEYGAIWLSFMKIVGEALSGKALPDLQDNLRDLANQLVKEPNFDPSRWSDWKDVSTVITNLSSHTKHAHLRSLIADLLQVMASGRDVWSFQRTWNLWFEGLGSTVTSS